jgi:two-component system chemotaxis sensor kinase CheA
MFAEVSNLNMPEPAEPALLQSLEAIVRGELPQADAVAEAPAAPVEPAVVEPEPAPPAPADDLFDTDAAPAGTADDEKTVGDFNEISENEFESLLDELHGVGGAPGRKSEEESAPATAPDTAAAADASDPNRLAEILNSKEDEISDEEFELLLDALHGVGKSGAPKPPAEPVAPVQPPAVVEAPKPAAPEPAPAPAPVAVSPAPAPVADKPKAAPKPAAKAPPKGPVKDTTMAAETTVRVDTQRLDEIMNMVGELVLVRNRLVRLGLKSTNEAMAKAVANLDVVTADLQTSVMKTRMQPIKKVFGRFPRVVRDLARNLKKEVNLELRGEETDLDKNLVEALADPLVHLVRNAVDHGIEKPDQRESVGYG